MTNSPDDLLTVENLTKHFPIKGGGVIHAVNGVSLRQRRGETIGIVGESGCGKSTLARLLVGLDSPDGGQVSFGGDDVAALRGAPRRRFHRRAQMVFQDPHTSLNPRLTVGETLGEALRVHGIVPVPQIAGRVALRGVALPLQPDLLAGGDAGRNLDVELAAGRQADALVAAPDRFLQRHRHGDGQIEVDADPAAVEFKRAGSPGAAASAASAATRGVAEHAVEDVLEAAAAHAAAGATTKTVLEAAARTGTAAGATAREPLEARLALGIDLAAVELLALVLVADDLVGRVDLRKAGRGLRVVLVVIRVMFLGELAIGALDRRSAGAPLHPQDLIGVAHPSRLLHGKSPS